MSYRPQVLPVIDVLDRAQAVRNAGLAFGLGADGIIFDHADEDDGVLLAVAAQLKPEWPEKILGAGYATLDPVKALQRSVRNGLYATWTTRVDVTGQQASSEALEAAGFLKANPSHRLFTAIAPSSQPEEGEPGLAAMRAHGLGMIPTTDGERIGPSRKLKTIRSAIGSSPLALAGSFMPESLGALSSFPTHLLVHTAGDAGFAYLDLDALRNCMIRVIAATHSTFAG